MSVKVEGAKGLIAELESRLGEDKMREVSDKGLKSGAKVFMSELKSQFETFKDTGASISEMTMSEPYWEGSVRTIKIHWSGPKNRYRIIHLNEYGTVKNPNPRGKGAIARSMRNAESAYRQAIKRAIEEGI